MVAAPVPAARAADAPPCRTLYVRNLPEKLPAAKLRELLHAAASPHGAVVWVAAAKTLTLRGQAFLTFADLAGATAAMRALHGAQFLGRPLAVGYARSVSDRAAADPGRAKAVRRESKAERAAAREKAAGEATAAAEAQAAAAVVADGKSGGGGGGDRDASMADAAGGGAVQAGPGLPNKILFAERLPEAATAAGAAVLSDLFARFAGFVEVRAVPGRRDIAFVEFEAEAQAAIALSGMDGHVLGEEAAGMALSYAKK
jgi:U2 small nuclear ribonucleoprotein B''